jgi:preprotein translocase subunit SecF
VLDRVRENLKLYKDKIPYDDIINKSIVQSFTRSINTSLTTLLAIIAILIFGGSTIRDFSFTLLFGIMAGTYSSIFIAAPLLVVWNKLSEHKVEEIKKEVKMTQEISKVQVVTNSIKNEQYKNKKKKKGGKRKK